MADEAQPSTWVEGQPPFVKMYRKAAFKGRMQDLGLWKRFVRDREQLKKRGVDPVSAWEFLMEYYNELDSVEDPTAVDPKVFAGKDCPEHVAIRWVAEHLECDPTAVKPEEAPSARAWGLYRWATRSPTNRNRFWESHYTKILESQKTIDTQSRMSDDGSSVLDLIERTGRIMSEDDRTET